MILELRNGQKIVWKTGLNEDRNEKIAERPDDRGRWNGKNPSKNDISGKPPTHRRNAFRCADAHDGAADRMRGAD